ncbi:MAG: hypothetical protein E7190_13845 [Erysipelotrichaceae bacterium]|nr:hypothetical protein [Erysipelotrichaceae bacterium]
MDEKQIETGRGSQLGRMKRIYFLAVMGCYILSYLVMYGISEVILTIFPVHPYITLAVDLLLLAAAVSVTKWIVDIELKDRWIRR